MSGRKHPTRPVPGLGRRELSSALVLREDRLRVVMRQFLAELNAAVPMSLLVEAARARDFSPATQTSLLAQAQTRLDAVLQRWHRPLEELLMQPQRRVRKAWDDLPFHILSRIVRAQLGDLIRQLSAQQMETVRRQLAALVQHGATDEILEAIGDTTGLTAAQSTAVRNTYETVLRESGPRAAVRAATQHRERLTEYRASLIARTEATRYLGSVVHARGEQMGGNVVKAWVSARDLNVDAGDRFTGPCVIGDDGLWYAIHEPFANGLMQPPAHPGCLPGYALVTASPPIAAQSERWFEGDLVCIRTAGGKNLSCTPNHPILTDRGWLPAASLDIGSQVVCHDIGERVATPVNYDGYQIPSLFEDVARAFRIARPMAAMLVPCSAPDFHGDGEGSEVAVVRSDRLLRNRRNPTSREHRFQLDLVGAPIRPSPLPTGRHPAALGEGVRTARGVMGRSHLVLPLRRRHLPPLQAFSLASVAGMNAVIEKESSHRNATDAALLRQSILRHAGAIQLEQVRGIRRTPFAGHVYNLETEDGWYAAEGIVVHNCRCLIQIEQLDEGSGI